MQFDEIYQPEQDSYFLESQVKKYLSSLKNKAKNIQVLDMGSGSGIQALACINSGVPRTNVLCADINPKAIKHLEKNKLVAVHSNLFSKIPKSKKFSLIIFNPPYLPEHKYDKGLDTTAGKRGNEIILKFLKQAKLYLAEGGVILLLFSSLSKPEEILAYSKKRGYNCNLLAEKSIGMMEKLFIWEFD